jgi:hypothetical protein
MRDLYSIRDALAAAKQIWKFYSDLPRRPILRSPLVLAKVASSKRGPTPTESRERNLRRCAMLWPYNPIAFSRTYSDSARSTVEGSAGVPNMRLMVTTERPELLCVPFRTDHVVLRDRPSALAWSSSVTNPAATRASRSSRIFAACRAFFWEESPYWRVAVDDSHEPSIVMRRVTLRE